MGVALAASLTISGGVRMNAKSNGDLTLSLSILFLAVVPVLAQPNPRVDGEYQNAGAPANVIRYTTDGIKTFVRVREDMTIPRMITRQGDQSVAKIDDP